MATTKEINEALTTTILKALKEDGFNPAAVKSAIEYVKAFREDTSIIPGSKVDEIEEHLSGMPSFNINEG